MGRRRPPQRHQPPPSAAALADYEWSRWRVQQPEPINPPMLFGGESTGRAAGLNAGGEDDAETPDHRSALRPFSVQIVLDVYRWERLRRTSDYQDTAARWKSVPSVTVSDVGTIVPDVWNVSLRARYQRDCARWGLRKLFDPALVITLQEMTLYPIFADTPRRQPVKVSGEEAWRRVVRRLAATAHATRLRSGGGTCTLILSTDEVDRLRYLHFRDRAVAPGPFQVTPPVRRLHPRVLEKGLTVFWQVEQGLSTRAIARELRLTRDQVITAFRVAYGYILDGTDAVQRHWQTCRVACLAGRIDHCEWMRRFGPPGLRDHRWLPGLRKTNALEERDERRPRRSRRPLPDPLERLPHHAGPELPARGKGRRPPE